jgi:hypothetical protein
LLQLPKLMRRLQLMLIQYLLRLLLLMPLLKLMHLLKLMRMQYLLQMLRLSPEGQSPLSPAASGRRHSGEKRRACGRLWKESLTGRLFPAG